MDRRRKGGIAPTSLAFTRGLGLPEVRPAVVTKEACPRLPEVVWSCVGVARNLSSDPPLDTCPASYYIQDAVSGYESSLLDLVRSILSQKGHRFEGR